MGDLPDHPPQFRRILTDNGSIHLGQSQTLEGPSMLRWTADAAFTERNADHFFCHGLYLISATVLPLFWAIISGLFRLLKPAKVARMTLWGLWEPKHLVKIF
jgi:hypothetical protein